MISQCRAGSCRLPSLFRGPSEYLFGINLDCIVFWLACILLRQEVGTKESMHKFIKQSSPLLHGIIYMRPG